MARPEAKHRGGGPEARSERAPGSPAKPRGARGCTNGRRFDWWRPPPPPAPTQYAMERAPRTPLCCLQPRAQGLEEHRTCPLVPPLHWPLAGSVVCDTGAAKLEGAVAYIYLQSTVQHRAGAPTPGFSCCVGLAAVS